MNVFMSTLGRLNELVKQYDSRALSCSDADVCVRGLESVSTDCNCSSCVIEENYQRLIDAEVILEELSVCVNLARYGLKKSLCEDYNAYRKLARRERLSTEEISTMERMARLLGL